uniref:Uncharacterized protein n=1 Tax=Lepeophtheirus salmonis TaxID=72036 RepID=A0A0K2TCZ7_LEPSM
MIIALENKKHKFRYKQPKSQLLNYNKVYQALLRPRRERKITLTMVNVLSP